MSRRRPATWLALAVVALAAGLVHIGFSAWGADDAGRRPDQPSFSTCESWLETGRAAVEPADLCFMPDEPQRERVREQGGSVFPIDYQRYFIVSTPESWDPANPPPIVLLLHGSAGCAEVLFNEWECAAGGQGFVVAALQFTDRDPNKTTTAEDPAKLYGELRGIVGRLREACPLADSPVVLFGVSYGAVMAYSLAVLDRAAPEPLFDTFVVDSGGWPLHKGQQFHYVDALNDPDGQAFAGARFWMHCNRSDQDRCSQMAEIAEGLASHGGTVDEFYFDEFGWHGIFALPTQAVPGAATWALFDYLRDFPVRGSVR